MPSKSGRQSDEPNEEPSAHDEVERAGAVRKKPRRVSAKESADRFVRGLLIRGEAAKTKDGELPPGATHEVVEEDESGLPTKVRRKRFSVS
jgi:hypothetical protein